MSINDVDKTEAGKILHSLIAVGFDPALMPAACLRLNTSIATEQPSAGIRDSHVPHDQHYPVGVHSDAAEAHRSE
ncbi:unnamed protein product [Phytophthora lilii]|uniref:Unnamed protein product n=1 Tax=Phytophthora lilii TaxID=2077276 RepID=A0A9W6TRT5_9STRA|nr:unnamed protein product [Phytophthora lilii]